MRVGFGSVMIIVGIVVMVTMLFYSFTDEERLNTEFDLWEDQVLQIDAPGGMLKAASKEPFDLRQKGTDIILSSKPVEGKVMYEVADESASAGEWHLTGGKSTKVLVNGTTVKVESSFWYKLVIWIGWLLLGGVIMILGWLIIPSEYK